MDAPFRTKPSPVPRPAVLGLPNNPRSHLAVAVTRSPGGSTGWKACRRGTAGRDARVSGWAVGIRHAGLKLRAEGVRPAEATPVDVRATEAAVDAAQSTLHKASTARPAAVR